MPTSLRDTADVVNASLVRIGFKSQIGNLYDGSMAANATLSVYGQTRDELMRSADWDFTQRSDNLVLLKSAPVNGYVPPTTWNPAVNPPLPWSYEYGYPDNCLKLRTVKTTPIFLPDFDPGPDLWSIANDQDLGQRVILCNIQSAIAIYTGRITNPQLWAVDFAEALIELLGERIAATLTSMDAAKLEAAEGNGQAARAEMEQG